jgi:hypothetical protein
MTKEEAMFSTSTLRRLPVALALAGAVCAFTVPQALAGGTSKDGPSETAPTSLSPVERIILQEKARRNDPRLYVGGVVPAPSSVPDVFERYAASHPYGKPASTPQQISVPLYTPIMLAAHFNREDLLYHPRPSLSTNPATTVSRGFHWTDWAIGLGSGIALILALAGLLAFALQRRHRLQAA